MPEGQVLAQMRHQIHPLRRASLLEGIIVLISILRPFSLINLVQEIRACSKKKEQFRHIDAISEVIKNYAHNVNLVYKEFLSTFLGLKFLSRAEIASYSSGLVLLILQHPFLHNSPKICYT